jgi:hypothetical protein
MKQKKYLEGRIRGWLPKEPVFPNARMAKMKFEAKTEGERRALKMVEVANVTMLGICLVTYFFD